jgi:hypothetical protein
MCWLSFHLEPSTTVDAGDRSGEVFVSEILRHAFMQGAVALIKLKKSTICWKTIGITMERPSL